MTITTQLPKGDVFFISHGGPTSMYDNKSGAYHAWKNVGKLIRKADTKGIVIVSAHWESERDGAIQVNVDESNPLIYDFYGFPDHYYKETFKSHVSSEIGEDVTGSLEGAGFKVDKVKRGLDHGAWVPLRAAFGGALDLPLLQVSLPSSSNPVESVKLGRGLSSLRDKGYTVIGSGQVVHNLRDLMMGRSTTSYSGPFLAAAIDAVHSSKPAEAVATLFRHPLYKSAHPTPEHLLPLAVAAGAVDAGEEVQDLLQEVDEKGLGWGMWRWTPQQTVA